jgi:hypothetical protein
LQAVNGKHLRVVNMILIKATSRLAYVSVLLRNRFFDGTADNSALVPRGAPGRASIVAANLTARWHLTYGFQQKTANGRDVHE